jgi:hypothetical protein
MSIKKISSKNTTALYFIAFIIILVAFFLLGGGPWVRDLLYRHGVGTLHWAQIMISLCIGFMLGLILKRRR